MQENDNKNVEELNDLEVQTREMQELIEQHQMKQQAVKSENQKLLKAIQEGRAKDVQQNQGLIDGINRKDRELDDLHKKIQSEALKRQGDLERYNQDCEAASL